jgi:Glutamine synthetase
MSDRPTADDVRKAVKDDGIEFLFANFVDMHARPSAKLIPAEELESLFTDGAGFAGFAAGDIGQQPNDPDMIAMPDVGSFTKLPWRPNVGWFASNVTVEGEEWPYCPRTILRHQMERCEEMGYQFKIGYELEYFLLRQTEDGGIEIADKLDTLELPCYDIRALTRSFDFVSEVIKNVNSLGWGLYATDHEDANGQFEQNFGPSDPLTAAIAPSSTATWWRRWRRSAADRHLHAEAVRHLTGNGCHMHMSLWDGDTNVFLADRDKDERGMGLSEKGYNFVGGLKKHAKAYIALTAPAVNSYKRLVIGAPTSGATWAPAYVTYGGTTGR